MPNYKKIRRPGFFGRRRDEIITKLHAEFGQDNWTLVWDDGVIGPIEFEDACKYYYETSYIGWFIDYPEELDFICEFGECIDNAETNVQSGCDYTKQEAFSTHIQDIAIRNVLRVFGRKFEGSIEENGFLVIRTADSLGFKYGPGNIPFLHGELIEQPSKCPRWANKGSVEDFWQSNKWIAVRE